MPLQTSMLRWDLNRSTKASKAYIQFKEWYFATYMVIKGMAAQIAEQICVATSGGAAIPWVIPSLWTRLKYSPVPNQTTAAIAIVNTHPPANTMPRQLNPRRSPKTILFFSCPFCGAEGAAGGDEELSSLAPPCSCATCKYSNKLHPVTKTLCHHLHAYIPLDYPKNPNWDSRPDRRESQRWKKHKTPNKSLHYAHKSAPRETPTSRWKFNSKK